MPRPAQFRSPQNNIRSAKPPLHGGIGRRNANPTHTVIRIAYRRHCGFAGHTSGGRQLSIRTDHLHRLVPGGRQHRRGDAGRWRRSCRSGSASRSWSKIAPAPAACWRRQRRQGGARRQTLLAAASSIAANPTLFKTLAVRHAQGPAGGVADLPHAAGAGGQSEAAGAIGRGADRAR